MPASVPVPTPNSSSSSSSNSNEPVPGSRVLVFGGNRGIGRAITERFLAGGCAVAYSSRTPAEGGITAPPSPGPALYIPSDLTNPAEGPRAVEQAAQELGGLDTVVFGSAVFSPRERIATASFAEVQDSLTVNLSAAYAVFAAAIPFISKSPAGGRLIAITSITGPRTGLPGMAHYGMAKSGLEGLVRSAALELAPHGVTVNAVEPGLIRTESLENSYGQARLDLMDSLHPGGAMGKPSDIAATVAWLASPGARHVNGAVIVVDGGLTLVENPYAP